MVLSEGEIRDIIKAGILQKLYYNKGVLAWIVDTTRICRLLRMISILQEVVGKKVKQFDF